MSGVQKLSVLVRKIWQAETCRFWILSEILWDVKVLYKSFSAIKKWKWRGKNTIKAKIKKFRNKYFYFKTVWLTLKNKKCDKIYDILSSDKGVFPFEKFSIFFASIWNLKRVYIFKKDVLYSKTKKNMDELYEYSKYL